MRDVARHATGVAAGAGLLALLLHAGHPVVSDPTEGSVLRIALRTTAGTVSDCRKLSQEEIDATPMHMRRAEICETRALPYRLEVEIAGRRVLDRTYTAAGIHGDRPLTVDEEIGLAAGSHEITARFAPAVGDDTSTPRPAFAYAGAVAFTEGRIRVVTLDAGGTKLEVR